MCMYTKGMNYLGNLYDAISVPVAFTRGAVAERLRNLHNAASFLYERTKQTKDTGSYLRTLRRTKQNKTTWQ